MLCLTLLGCRESAKQPEWTKARKIAGRAQKLSHISGLVVDNKFAYVTMGGTLADQKEGTSGLRKIDLDTGEVGVLDDGQTNLPQSDLGGLAIDERYIYWNASGRILRLSKDGGQPEPIASEHVGMGADIVVDSERVYWANHEYYSPNSPTRPSPIYWAPKQGGPPQVFIDQQNIPHSLVLDEKYVYWVTPTSVLKKAKAGGEPQVIFQAANDEGIDELAQDADNLYFAFRGAGKSRWALRNVSKQGGAAKMLAQTLTLGQIAVDDANVYFFDENSLTKDDLCRVAKDGGEMSRLDTGYSNGIIVVSGRLIYFPAGEDLYRFAK